MTRPRVVLTDSNLPSDGGAAALLQRAGIDFEVARCRTAEEVAEVAAEADGLIVQWAPITAEVLDAAPRCRVVSRLGIGCDMIDVDAATARGVAVANTPDYCVEEVAAHTVALALAALRGVVALDRSVREGRWQAPVAAPHAIRPSRTTAAVVGYGRIGARVAAALAASGIRVLVCDPHVAADRVTAAGHEPAPLEDALARADLVSLHAPLTASTRHLLDAERIALLPRGSWIVNTCRGELIDEQALVAALADGRLGGAALDVFATEPLPPESPLRELPNVLLGPHAAWYSPAALEELPRRAAESVVDFFAGRPVAAVVNPGYRDAAPPAVGTG